MQLQQLKYIVEVARTGSMNKAAHSLFISQPNLSSAIGNLEKELSITLFNRTNKGVELTNEGKLFLKYAKSILGQVEQVENIYRGENKENVCLLEIAQNKSLYLGKAINNTYNKLNKNTAKIMVHVKGLSQVIKDVAQMKVEIGIIAMSYMQQNIVGKMLDQRKLEYSEIGISEVGVVVGEHSSLYYKKQVTIEDLSGLTYVGYLEENESAINYSVEIAEIWPNFAVRTININDMGSVMEFLTEEDAYSFDLMANQNYLHQKKLKCIPLKECIDISIGCIKRKKEPLSDEAVVFVDEVKVFYGYK